METNKEDNLPYLFLTPTLYAAFSEAVEDVYKKVANRLAICDDGLRVVAVSDGEYSLIKEDVCEDANKSRPFRPKYDKINNVQKKERKNSNRKHKKRKK